MGLRIRKKLKVNVEDITIDKLGISLENYNKEEKRIIVSLTTFPQRINTVHKTIKTLLNQTLKPNKVILYLALSQFEKKEEELPNNLLKLKDYGLEIKWCEDIKSYKKLIPALEEFKDDIIITFDDDIYYPKDVVENLYNAHLAYPFAICSNRIWRIEVKNNFIKTKAAPYLYWKKYNKPDFLNGLRT